MPRKNKQQTDFPNGYMTLYMFFVLLEIFYIFLLLSPYGKSDKNLKKIYITVKNNINTYIMIGLIFLTISSFVFPGIGWLAFVITLWRVAEMCCTKNEEFGDGLNYSFNRYYQDNSTYFNEAEIERNLDGTRAAYSSAVGDTEDIYWLSKLAKYKNQIANKSYNKKWNEKLVYVKDGCGCNNYIIPQIKENSITECGDYLCDSGCNKCSIKEYGNIFEMMNTPRPLYTTSLLSKEIGSS
jgi:hypothetical protein